MILNEILQHDLHSSHSAIAHCRLKTISEAMNVYDLSYSNYRKDPSPAVVILGRWRQPRTGNILVGGININALSNNEKNKLDSVLSQIMVKPDLKSKYWEGRKLVPNIFRKAYRTYDQQYITRSRGDNWTPSITPPDVPEVPTQDSQEKPAQENEKHSIVSNILDKMHKYGSKLKNLLSRNKAIDIAREKLQHLQQTEKQVEKLSKQTTDDETIADLKQLDQELDKLSQFDIEDSTDEDNNSKLNDFDLILESQYPRQNLKWRSRKHYINWHMPDKFMNYDQSLNGCPADFARGNACYLVHHMPTDTAIVDIIDSCDKMLVSTGWELKHTKCYKLATNGFIKVS